MSWFDLILSSYQFLSSHLNLSSWKSVIFKEMWGHNFLLLVMPQLNSNLWKPLSRCSSSADFSLSLQLRGVSGLTMLNINFPMFSRLSDFEKKKSNVACHLLREEQDFWMPPKSDFNNFSWQNRQNPETNDENSENTMTSKIKELTSGAVFLSHLAKSFFEIRPTPETRKTIENRKWGWKKKVRRAVRSCQKLSAVCISESGAMDIHFGPMHLKLISCWSTASKVS